MSQFINSFYNFLKQFESYYYSGIKGEPLPIDSPIYVHRKADDQLYQFLRTTEPNFCTYYILSSPQMGKSSLMIKTASRLRFEGYICTQLGLKILDPPLSDDILYFGILQKICQGFTILGESLYPQLEVFWQKSQELTSGSRFIEFIKYILQKIKPAKIIVFLDDIEILMDWNLQSSLMGVIKILSESEEECLQRLAFLVLGIAAPSDLLFDTDYVFNTAKMIELSPLQGDCQPLLAGLSKVSQNPAGVLREILWWTGGQPFLTQILCDLVAKSIKIKEGENSVNNQIEGLVTTKVILAQTRPEIVFRHFQAIESWFSQGDPKESGDKLLALRLYKRLLQNPQSVKFRESSRSQRDLLISGLVTKSYEFLGISNPIYPQIFNLNWVEETQKIVKQKRDVMADQLVYNRDVFFLIDRSGSMILPDAKTGGKKRWDYLQETVLGHVDEILNEEDPDCGKICDEITLYFFNGNQRPGRVYTLRDASQVQDLFRAKENKPGGATYIALTLQEAVDTWLANRTDEKGAFLVIYTDGKLDDRDEFVNVIGKTCERVNSQDDIKILLIGVGSEVDNEATIDFYVGLDAGAKKFRSKQGELCNIFVFDLIDDVMDEGLISALQRQLIPDPNRGLASWIEKRYPNIYKKYSKPPGS
ncbi:AAA-like domain-containing protein [Argonema antarcticum]|uniref:AAA-like domain-containing protein n=1 Tax=Argonema antarcticum TaxID=2942763 RepID=UPI0020126525|nr:AAA-like domain-containing protein [Argonema antarcticum]MCL1471090.1 AAA-like domain-containing protein [Argonema antarcticum A004/B2]